MQSAAAIEIAQHQGAQVERRRGVFRGGDRSRQIGEGGGVIDPTHGERVGSRDDCIGEAAAVVRRDLDLARRGVGIIGTVGITHRPQGTLEVGRRWRGVGGGLDP